METRIMRRIASASGLILGLALAGCGPVNRGVESVNQPVVSRTDYVLDVAAGPSGLAPGEDARLTGWFTSLRLGYGDRIAVDDPSRYGSSDARRAVAQVAGRFGLLLSSETPVTTGSPGPGRVRVIISRSVAEVPGCPDWSRPSQPEYAASTSSNYGCATNTNLAAMIANPEDLVRGQVADGSGDPLATAKAIQSYRQAAPKTELKSESTGGGK